MSRSPLVALVLVATSVAGTTRADGVPLERRWVWIMANLLVDKEADRVVALIERAGKAGYNGAVLSDTKFNILGWMPERYFEQRRAGQGGGREGEGRGHPVGLPDRLQQRPACQ